MKLRNHLYVLPVLLVIVFMAGCSVEKNTSLSRNYHNLISHYNIYFNGNESYKKGLRKIDQNFQEDFSSILPVFKFGDKSVASLVSSDMDRAIAKTSKLVTLHSITVKPELKSKDLNEREKAFYDRNEFNNWVDDSYLLMGKAQTYKHEYFLALKTFKYVNGSAIDQQIKYLAMIWMARIYNEQGNYDKSLEILNVLQDITDFPPDLNKELYATIADYYLKQKNYKQASPWLKKLTDLKMPKAEKARFLFLFAQVSEQTGNNEEAYQSFHKVLRLKPDYEMAFNARIRQAESFEVTPGNVADIKKGLRRMLRDEKNKEYRDQIYYAFGQIALKEGDKSEAIDFFKKSAVVSVSNNKQKGVSYLSIADLFFLDEKYIEAQAYYDSAVSTLNPDYPGYEIISKKSRGLTRLVTQLNTVTREDSLQRIARLPANEQLALVDELIQQLKEEEQKKKEQGLLVQGQYNPSSYYESEQRIRQELNKSGKWYFYNPAVVGYGRTEFKKKWGDRKLEDNWRRLNKSISEMNLANVNEGENTSVSDSAVVEKNDKYNRQTYLKNLPSNDSLIKISNQRIEKSLFNAGEIYKDELKDYSKASEEFETLISRFPGSTYLPAAYFYLNDLKKKLNEPADAALFKQKLIMQFPETEYAKILGDPDYLRKRNEKEQGIYHLYEKLYSEFLKGNLIGVITQCDTAIKKYSKHELFPKFSLLKAYAIGRQDGVREFKKALQELVKEVPEGEEKKRASELIAYFNASNPTLQEEDEVKKSVEIYHFSSEDPHLVILIAEKKNLDVNQLIFDVINFNLDQYPQTEFSTHKQDLDARFNIVTISGFKSIQEAGAYLSILRNDNTIKNELAGRVVFSFLISQSNFNSLLKNKSISIYEKFYKKYYLEYENGDSIK